MAEKTLTQKQALYTIKQIMKFEQPYIVATEDGYKMVSKQNIVEIIAEPGLATYKLNGKYVATTHSSMNKKTASAAKEIKEMFDLYGKICAKYLSQKAK